MRMEVTMRESGRTTKHKAREYLYTQMDQLMKGVLKMISKRALDLKNGLMEVHMKVLSQMERRKGMGFLLSQISQYMKVLFM